MRLPPRRWRLARGVGPEWCHCGSGGNGLTLRRDHGTLRVSGSNVGSDVTTLHVGPQPLDVSVRRIRAMVGTYRHMVTNDMCVVWVTDRNTCQHWTDVAGKI
jgi:hypothetical protein